MVTRTEVRLPARPLGQVKAWSAGRPERGTLLLLLGLGSLLAIALAITPSSSLQGVAGRIPGGSEARQVLLDHHTWVFGLLGAALALAVLLAPSVFNLLNRIVDWLTSLDRRVFLGGVIALTIASRLLLVGRMPPIIPNEDPGHYLQLANTILDEGRYIEYGTQNYRAWRPPAFPMALSMALFLTGRNLWSIVALNTAWMVVLLLSLYFLVERLGSERQARLAVVACAFYPTLLASSLEARSAVQFSALLMLATFLLFGRRGLYAALLGGLALGLAALTRGNGLLMLPMLLAAYALYQPGRPDSRTRGSLGPPLRRIGLIVLGFAIAIGPWTIRNRIVMDHWIPIGTSGGMNMWRGHHPGGAGLHRPEYKAPYPKGLTEVELANYGTRESLKYWLREPMENLRIGARIVFAITKVDSGLMEVIYRDGVPEQGRGRSVGLGLLGLFNLIYYGTWFLVLTWGVARLAGRWPRGSRPGVLVLVAVLYLLTFIPFQAFQRYKEPMLPFLVASAGMVLAVLARPSAASREVAR